MDNYKQLTKKSISANRTFKNWMNRRRETNPNYGKKREESNFEQIKKERGW